MRRWIIEKLGGHVDGFRNLDEAIQYIRDTQDLAHKHEILTLAVKKLFNTIGEADILKTYSQNTWTLQGRPLREAEIGQLKAEVAQFKTTRLWQVMQLELNYWANKKMFITSETVDDLVAGKLLVYYVDIVKSFLKRIEGKQNE